MSATPRTPVAYGPCWHAFDEPRPCLELHGEWDCGAEADLQLMSKFALEADELLIDMSRVSFAAVRLAEWVLGISRERKLRGLPAPTLQLSDVCERLSLLIEGCWPRLDESFG